MGEALSFIWAESRLLAAAAARRLISGEFSRRLSSGEFARRLSSGLPARSLRARSTASMVNSWWRRLCTSSRTGPSLSFVSLGAAAIASRSVETARVDIASRWLPTCPRRGAHL